MVRYDKAAKESHVSGWTGSSVADVNSVSLAMPVCEPQETTVLLSMLTLDLTARYFPLVGPPVSQSHIHTLHTFRYLRRLPD